MHFVSLAREQRRFCIDGEILAAGLQIAVMNDENFQETSLLRRLVCAFTSQDGRDGHQQDLEVEP